MTGRFFAAGRGRVRAGAGRGAAACGLGGSMVGDAAAAFDAGVIT